MKFPWRYVLVGAALMVGCLLLAACGGEEQEETPTAVATLAETPEGTISPAAGEVPEIPAYPGATDIKSDYHSDILPVVIITVEEFQGQPAISFQAVDVREVVGDIPVEPEQYRNVRYSAYQTEDSADDVLDFYKNEFRDWGEEFSSDIDEAGMKGHFAIWTKDAKNIAVWMVAVEAKEIRITDFTIGIGFR